MVKAYGEHPAASAGSQPPVIPLAQYERLRSRSVEEIRGYVSSIFCPHRLQPKTRDGRLDARINHAPLGSASLNYLRYGVPVVVEPGELGSFFLVQIQLSGGVEVSCGQQRASLGVGQASVLSPTEYARMAWTDDAEELIVQLERAAMERFLSSLLGRELPRPLVFDVGMDCRQGPSASWWRTVRFLLGELENAETLLAAPLAAKQFEQTLMCSLLYSQPHNYSDALQGERPQAAPRHVKLAEEYIHAHADDPISVEELADIAGVSVRTLFSGFQHFRGISPMKCLRHVRLERVHRDLSEATPGTTVTDVALRWGFSQLGRFAAEYRRHYGETPSDTLKRSQRLDS